MPRPTAFFDYLEERPLGSLVGRRYKRVPAVDDRVAPSCWSNELRSSLFGWECAHQLEEREATVESEGVWLLSQYRVSRYLGNPGRDSWPYRDLELSPTPIPEQLGTSVRIHHYYRLLSSIDCVRVAQLGGSFSLGLEVTEEWFDPPDGIISSTPAAGPVIGSHCIGGLDFVREYKMFRFPNSWGKSWGRKGWGMVSGETIDRRLVECWAMVGPGLCAPLSAKSGLVSLLWKSSAGGQQVHGREIVNAASGERLGWCFMVRRGGFLDIEELFVWPKYRRQGFGRILAELALSLASKMQTKVRALISYADAGTPNRPALNGLMASLNLSFHPSSLKGVAYFGLDEPHLGILREPYIPKRPAATRDRLDPSKGTRLYTVWYGTNRKPNDPNDLTKGFSSERDNRTHYGNCSVSIPKSHRFGSVGSSWWQRWLRWTDDRLSVVQRKGLLCDVFWSELAACIAESHPDERHGLVFIHGYNVSFDEAAIRAAQIGFDLKVPGVTGFFSWPSCASAAGYPADEACIEASEPFIADFLDHFATYSGVDRVHIVAHSMGNRGLIRALQLLASTSTLHRQGSFGQIILAAPDIDTMVFTRMARFYTQFAERTTLYTSPADRAIAISQWLHGFPRAGLAPPITIVPGIDTINVPSFDVLQLLGHGYYAEAEGLLHDIFDLMRRNAPPSDRQRLTSAQTPEGLVYWEMNP